MSKCAPIAKYPKEIWGAMAGLSLDETPIICGGKHFGPSYSECYTYNDKWQQIQSMKYPSSFGAEVSSHYASKKHHFIITGGRNGTDSNSQNYVRGMSYDGQWEDITPALPNNLNRHCLVSINSSSLMAIGGWQNENYVAATLILHDGSTSWISGPSLNTSRYGHGCARIRFSFIKKFYCQNISELNFYQNLFSNYN